MAGPLLDWPNKTDQKKGTVGFYPCMTKQQDKHDEEKRSKSVQLQHRPGDVDQPPPGSPKRRRRSSQRPRHRPQPRRAGQVQQQRGGHRGPEESSGPAHRAWWVYIVECADGTYYTGITVDVLARIVKHNTGNGAKYTRVRARRPVTLRYVQACLSHSHALKMELQFKKLSRKQKAVMAEEGQWAMADFISYQKRKFYAKENNSFH